MKYTVKFILAALMTVTAIACEGPIGPTGPQGPAGPTGPAGKDGKDGSGEGVNWSVYKVDCADRDWTLKDGYYSATFKLEDLTDFIYDEGLVQAYIDYGDAQAVLPVVRHCGDGEFLWTQTIDYEFAPGEITFFVTNSDFYTEERPGDASFKVVLMW